MRFRRQISLLLTALMLLFCMAGTAHAASDTSGHWCEAEMNQFMELGIISGDGSGALHPDNAITRAEFVKIINGVFGFRRTGTIYFSDAKESDWFYGDLAAGVRLGYLSGYPDGTVHPNANITRQEAAKILMTVMDEARPDGALRFTDRDRVAGWAWGSVAAADELGILNGYPDGTIRPENNITRAEAVRMLSNAVRGIFVASGEYTGPVDGSVVIGADGVSLRNAVISGNLYITEGAAGRIDLSGVTVRGRVVIAGDSGRTVFLTDAQVNHIDLKESAVHTKIVVARGTQVSGITVDAASDIEIQSGGKVDLIESNAAGTSIHGAGTAGRIKVNEDTYVAGRLVEAVTETSMGKTTGGSTGGYIPPVVPQPPVTQKGYALTAALDKTSYDAGDTIRAAGSVTKDGAGAAEVDVTLTVYCVGEDTLVLCDQQKTDGSGGYRFDFQMPETAEAGEYRARFHAGSPANLDQSLTFTLAGVSAVERSALAEQIQKAEALEKGDHTTDSWNSFQAALTEAKAVHDSASATQTMVDAATEKLAQAMGALVKKADKSKLEAAITEAKALRQDDYTTESYLALTEVVKHGEAVLAKENATATEVAKAAQAIRDAIGALKPAGTITAMLQLNGGPAPESYRAVLDASAAFPNVGDALAWVTEGTADGQPTVTVKSSDEAVLSLNVDQTHPLAVGVSGTLHKTGAATITAETQWDGTTVTKALAVSVVKEQTVEALDKAVSDAAALRESDYTNQDNWKAFAEARASAEAAQKNSAASDEELSAAEQALSAAMATLLEEKESDIAVSLKEGEQVLDPAENYKMYQGLDKTVTVVSDTAAADVQEITFNGDPEGGFHITLASADWVQKNKWNFTVYADNPGTYDLAITVKFADGTHKTVTLRCEVLEQVDKKPLQDAVAAAKSLVEANYTEDSWAAFSEALARAQAVAGAVVAQTEVDAARASLEAAMNDLALKEALDTGKLELVWYEGSGYETTTPLPAVLHVRVGDWVPASRAWLNVKGLQKGQIRSVTVEYDPDYIGDVRSMEGTEDPSPYVYRWRFEGKMKAEGTTEVTAVVTLIDGSEHRCSFTVTTEQETPEVDKTELTAAITAAEALVRDEYTTATWEAMQAALAAAREAAANESATQEQVDTALSGLQAAVDALEKKPVVSADKTELNAAITAAQALTESDYTASSWRAVKSALAAAQEAAAREDATQEEVDAAAEALRKAVGKLAGRVNKMKLETKASQANALTESDYTADSWTAMQTALAAAQQAVQNFEGLSIPEANRAYDDLAAAMSALEWADSVPFRSFTTAPGIGYSGGYIIDWAASAWMTEMKDGVNASVFYTVVGGHQTEQPTAVDITEYAMLYTNIGLTDAELSAALLQQCEMVVFECYDGYASAGGKLVGRYAARLAVNDGKDRSALYDAVMAARSYAGDNAEAVTAALADAKAVYANAASTQEEITAAAAALRAAMEGGQGGPDVSDVKDIGLTYGYGMFTINSDPGEYSDAYFQVVANTYTTELNDACLYAKNDWWSQGFASPSAGNPSGTDMGEYIKANCPQVEGKYIVTIKLYADYETAEPYMENGEPVEFRVWLTF